MSNNNYIMTPERFKSLNTFLPCFKKFNGNTYPEHICIIFNKRLSEKHKQSILTKNTEEAVIICNNATKNNVSDICSPYNLR